MRYLFNITRHLIHRLARPVFLPVSLRAALWALLLVIASPIAAQAQAQGTPAEKPARVLVIASDTSQQMVRDLVGFLGREYPVSIKAITPDAYTPLIDEQLYDGFVYLGDDYYTAPGDSFYFDMSRTSKPVLWINYHAWNFDAETQTRIGMSFQDQHSSAFTTINFRGMAPLIYSDTSFLEVRRPARVLYWLFSDDLSNSLPGAAISGNKTFVSYLPDFRIHAPGFLAFKLAADETFTDLKAGAFLPDSPAQRLATARADEFRAGVHLPFVHEGIGGDPIRYDSDEFHPRLLRVKDIGADWITISQTFFQDGVRGDEPAKDPIGTASLAELGNLVDDAHRVGLLVRLSVIVNLTEESRGPGDWRGYIRPKDHNAWWAAYRAIVLDAAQFAKDNGVESLNVGAELNRMQTDEDEWRALVSAVREEVGYEGLVGYQVNFDGFDTMTWGDALDYLSVAAYWPLAQTRSPDLGVLFAAWQQVGRDLDIWMQNHPDIDLEFGEIGYASQPYASMFPFSWKPNLAGQLDEIEQLLCYIALEHFLVRHPAISGVGVFASTENDLLPGNIGYSPFGKPAGEVVWRLMRLR